MKRRDNAHIILISGSRFLAQRRDRDTPVRPGHWGFFGGGMENGETPEVAAKRELLEELEYAPDEMEHLVSFEYSDENIGQYGTQHFFVAPLPSLNRLHQHEGEEMKLMTVDEALKAMEKGYHNLPALDALKEWFGKK